MLDQNTTTVLTYPYYSLRKHYHSPGNRIWYIVSSEHNKAYSANMSTFAFLEHAMEASPKHTDLTDEIVGLADRAQQVNKLLADLNRDITHLRQEFPLPVQRED